MPIVGFNFERINAERKKGLMKGMQAKHEVSIKSVDQEDLSSMEKNRQGIRFNFDYDVVYEPGIGRIILSGNIIYSDDDKKIKEILNQWKKNKEIPTDLKQQILNTAIMRSTIRALSLSQEVNLPPHLPIIPTISKRQTQQKESDYIG